MIVEPAAKETGQVDVVVPGEGVHSPEDFLLVEPLGDIQLSAPQLRGDVGEKLIDIFQAQLGEHLLSLLFGIGDKRHSVLLIFAVFHEQGVFGIVHQQLDFIEIGDVHLVYPSAFVG